MTKVSCCQDQYSVCSHRTDGNPALSACLSKERAPRASLKAWHGPGTMVISELDYKIYVHELVLEPGLDLRQVACFECPEPATEDKEEHSVSATWASDGSAVLLYYLIRDFSDDRAQFNDNGFFAVGPAIAMDTTSGAAAACLLHCVAR